MEKISIICLIYKSTVFAKSVYENIMRHTPELHNGEAEFYFVANDATPEVLNFLKKNNYPHYINNNPNYTDKQLFKMGWAFPDYIKKVYAGYNYGIRQAKNEIVVLINSDMFFSPNWLHNLKRKLTRKLALSPHVIQPKRFRNPINGSICTIHNCGKTVSTYDEKEFLRKAAEISEDSLSVGNLFMPVMIHKDNLDIVGLYPEGNIRADSDNFADVLYFGDVFMFKKLELIGVEHKNVNDSIIYHLDRGEINDKN